jgi:hypothetical protein
MNIIIKILAIILLVSLILLGGSILYLQFNDPRVIMDQNDLEENKVLVMTKNDEASYITFLIISVNIITRIF